MSDNPLAAIGPDCPEVATKSLLHPFRHSFLIESIPAEFRWKGNIHFFWSIFLPLSASALVSDELLTRDSSISLIASDSSIPESTEGIWAAPLPAPSSVSELLLQSCSERTANSAVEGPQCGRRRVNPSQYPLSTENFFQLLPFSLLRAGTMNPFAREFLRRRTGRLSFARTKHFHDRPEVRLRIARMKRFLPWDGRSGHNLCFIHLSHHKSTRDRTGISCGHLDITAIPTTDRDSWRASKFLVPTASPSFFRHHWNRSAVVHRISAGFLVVGNRWRRIWNWPNPSDLTDVFIHDSGMKLRRDDPEVGGCCTWCWRHRGGEDIPASNEVREKLEKIPH